MKNSTSVTAALIAASAVWTSGNAWGVEPLFKPIMAQAAPADPTKAADPIKGAEVMGDKNRSGPDGWVQAPVSRDEAPATDKKSAGETPKPRAASAPTAAKPMAPGDDPGAAIASPSSGPGRLNAAPN